MFEDFNYGLYNKYILIDPNREEGGDHTPLPGGFEPQVVEKNKRGVPMKQKDDDSQSQPLTENYLDTYKDDYQHNVFDVQTEDEKQMKKIELEIKKQKERER